MPDLYPMPTFSDYRRMLIAEATTRTKEEEIAWGKGSALSPAPFKKGVWKFVPKIHAPSQARDRRPKWKPEYWHELHDKIHVVLNDKRKQVAQQGSAPEEVHNGEVLFYSRKQKQGYFANVDKGSKLLHIITVLPAGNSRVNKPTDQRIILDHCGNLENYQIIFLD